MTKIICFLFIINIHLLSSNLPLLHAEEKGSFCDPYILQKLIHTQMEHAKKAKERLKLLSKGKQIDIDISTIFTVNLNDESEIENYIDELTKKKKSTFEEKYPKCLHLKKYLDETYNNLLKVNEEVRNLQINFLLLSRGKRNNLIELSYYTQKNAKIEEEFEKEQSNALRDQQESLKLKQKTENIIKEEIEEDLSETSTKTKDKNKNQVQEERLMLAKEIIRMNSLREKLLASVLVYSEI